MSATTLPVNRETQLINYRITGLLIVFLLWPFVALVVALRQFHKTDSRRIAYFFLIFYGLNFVIANFQNDASRYASELIITYNRPFSDFWTILIRWEREMPIIAMLR